MWSRGKTPRSLLLSCSIHVLLYAGLATYMLSQMDAVPGLWREWLVIGPLLKPSAQLNQTPQPIIANERQATTHHSTDQSRTTVWRKLHAQPFRPQRWAVASPDGPPLPAVQTRLPSLVDSNQPYQWIPYRSKHARQLGQPVPSLLTIYGNTPATTADPWLGTQNRTSVAFAVSQAPPRMIPQAQLILQGMRGTCPDHRVLDIDVPPLPKDEPGGRIACRDKDAQWPLRLARVRHNLSDWWTDTSSLNALIKWMNKFTRIRMNMDKEDRAVRLSDSRLRYYPVAFMTGHDPALVQSRQLVQGRSNRLTRQLSDGELRGLRRYVLEQGGLLVFDDCGVSAPSQTMIQRFIAQLRLALPEYPVGRIRNDHPLYSSYYQLNGPPVGFDIFWWDAKPLKRNYPETLCVGVMPRSLQVLVGSVGIPVASPCAGDSG